ncbi:MAG: cytochrome P450 [Spongiibacter marinus]|uniref:cytochrome P450 n=1 Tax=Spongiibacter marinus TaxID=354246 RepID=UPI003C68FE00
MESVEKLDLETGYRRAKDSVRIRHIPGSYGLPLVGRGIRGFVDFPGLIKEHYEKWGEVSRIQFGDQKGLLLLGADDIQRVFLDRDQNWSTEMGYQKTMRHFYDGGVLAYDFDVHKMQRRILQTCFKTESMRAYAQKINELVKLFIDGWSDDKPLEFYPEIKEILLRIGAEIFIGVDDVGEEYQKLNDAFLNIQAGFNDPVKKNIPGTPFYKAKKGVAYLRDYFTSLIPARRHSDKSDMLTLMSKECKEDGTPFSDEEISDHAAFILFAAHDTATSVLNHLVYYYAANQHWQERARKQSLALDKSLLDFDSLEAMSDVENGFYECMRLHPPIPILIRRSIRPTQLGGYEVPAHTPVMMAAIHNHYSEKYWSSPTTFDPDRFSSERNEKKSHPFAYFPFGGGAHKCIGMHFGVMLGKIFMHHMLLNFTFELPKNFEVKFQFVPLPKPEKLPLILSRRAN